MTIERALRMIAGFVIVISVILGAGVSPYWLLLTGLVGLNLMQSAFTNWCPAVWVLERLGLAHCSAVARQTV